MQAVEATFEGEFFFRQGQPFDWAWQSFYVNGVRWRGKEIPELPLIQPEKAAAMPLEILFTKEYRVFAARPRTRSTAATAGSSSSNPLSPSRDGTSTAARSGSTARSGPGSARAPCSSACRARCSRTRRPWTTSRSTRTARRAPWTGSSYFLPLKVTGQQILSVLNTATVVEKEVRLTGIRINGPEFDQRREEVLASESTMVRDTDKGFRYLVKDEATGERAVKEGFDSDRLFLIGGVLYDDSLDYPLPLVGVNYFNLDIGGKKRQLNAFFGGVLGIVNYADPRLFDSKFDLGADLFVLAIAGTDQLYRGGVESPGEEVEATPGASQPVNLGHPLGNFVKWSASYQLAHSSFSDSDDTAPRVRAPAGPLHSPPLDQPRLRPLRLSPGARRRPPPALAVGVLGPSRGGGERRIRPRRRRTT